MSKLMKWANRYGRKDGRTDPDYRKASLLKTWERTYYTLLISFMYLLLCYADNVLNTRTKFLYMLYIILLLYLG